MPDPVSSIKVEGQSEVDIQRQPSTTAVVVEETMEQYAARREAEMRGEKPVKPAAVTAEIEAAAATEKSAAATDEGKGEDKTATASATEDDEDPEKKIEEAHPAKKGIERKFSKLTKAKADAEAAAATAKEEAAKAVAESQRLAAELETARKAAEERALAVPDAEKDPKPERDAFDDPDEYEGAMRAHAARAEIRKANEQAQAETKAKRDAEAAEADTKRKAEVQEQITTLHKTFNERQEKAKTTYPDYEDKVLKNEKLILRNDVFFTIEQAEFGPDILYHLANNPDEAASLNTMHPITAALRLGELQSELKIARKPKPSKAAEPVRPVGARSSPDRKTPDEETMDEYAARRAREDAAAHAARRRGAH